MRKLDELVAGRPGERMILIKIWLPDATLAYSTNKESIGSQFPSRHITAALKGKATGEFDYLQDPENAAAKHLHTPLVEIYAPLFRTGTQEVIAVGEIYTDGRELAADLASIRLTSAAIVGAVTAPMMLILFLMVRGASNLVNGTSQPSYKTWSKQNALPHRMTGYAAWQMMHVCRPPTPTKNSSPGLDRICMTDRSNSSAC